MKAYLLYNTFYQQNNNLPIYSPPSSCYVSFLMYEKCNFLCVPKNKHCITCFTLYPVFALVSINMTFSSLALCSPSSMVICLESDRGNTVADSMQVGKWGKQDILELGSTCVHNKCKEKYYSRESLPLTKRP